MRDERAATTHEPVTTGHKIVRYLIGGWNTAIGAVLAMAGMLTSDPVFTALAVLTLVLGVGLLVGKRWAWILSLILIVLSVMGLVASGTNYGYSAAILQAVMFFGLIYAGPAFNQPPEQ